MSEIDDTKYLRPPEYVACPEDSSFQSVVTEALVLLEELFRYFDADGACALQFDEILRGLATRKFTQSDELKQCFDKVDTDQSGSLEFSEFFALILIWCQKTEKGPLKYFFPNGVNQVFVEKAMKDLIAATNQFDINHSLRLSKSELDPMMKEFFEDHVKSGLYEKTFKELYPSGDQELSLRNVLFVIYAIMCAAPRTKLKGTYLSSGGGPKGKEILFALEVLETDFKKVDTDSKGSDGSGTISFEELLKGSNWELSGSSQVDMVSRFHHYFALVDADNSQCLDFFEFVELSYLMTLGGSYSLVVKETKGSAEVKKAFTSISNFIKKLEKDRYTMSELSALFSAYGVPGVDALFAKYAKDGKVRTGDIFKIIYSALKPGGEFSDSKYAPVRRAVEKKEIESMGAAENAHPPRITTVEVAKFKEEKVLGQGGQGRVALGTYDGIKVAGKTFLSAPSPELIKEVKNEMAFFSKLDHPYCHFLIGYKDTLRNGGILVLTEVCDNGSIFDLYSKKMATFKKETCWRWARQCADGFAHIHGMGFMHRDIKSLNVFLTANYTCKVADFGMVTNEATAVEVQGTGQWMAPEVGFNALGLGAPRPYNKNCDIYSYAILVWELYHTQVPYSNYGNMTQMDIVNQVSRGLLNPSAPLFRPPITAAKVPPKMADIITSCWAVLPERRPTFSKVVEILDAIRAECL